MLTYKMGDLFTAPKGSYLAHACNCMGKWGSGIAFQFRDRFPKSYLEYQEASKTANPGDIFICQEENGYKVICLFTSKDYGPRVDSPGSILRATKKALTGLPADSKICMPKINSGLFNVPWEETEKLLQEYKDLDIVVYVT